MAISVLDLFSIGIGPSSSHTVGPMRAANAFLQQLTTSLSQVHSIQVDLYGSLGATGKGHGSDVAVLLGLQGEQPETVDTDQVTHMLELIRENQQLVLNGSHPIAFKEAEHLIMHRQESLPYHANGMRFEAFDASGSSLSACIYYSVGGGFIVDEEAAAHESPIIENPVQLPYPFKTGDELLALCKQHNLRISDIMLANERAWRTEEETRQALFNIWHVMRDCVQKGCQSEGILPGGMKVRRRAAELYRSLTESPEQALRDPLTMIDWVNLYALAVNEENAAGGRIVTAPTNGAAGIIPAVLHYYRRFVGAKEDDESIIRFLLTAGAIGVLYKENASISGAEVGCQGEVGSACSMAAGALCEVMGGTPDQVENAAEIAMEHNLGLTCDPVGGLVQVPCIERNAMASVKAINAVRMALRGDGQHFVSLDKVIKTMRDTGLDMKTKYKETARGGLAVNVVEVPVNFVEC